MIVNLTDASNVEVACLELTDHSSCVEFHTGGLACERDNYPYGDWAAIGLYAEDSADVHLRNLDIHGLAHTGIHAGRLTDWTVEDVRIAGNGWAGWDGDIDGNDSNSGTLLFRRWTVEWNGCGETYPGGQPTGCWAQTAGGYGDGVGTGATGGDWIIEDSRFLHNTSDGLDMLYHSLGGSITINRVRAEGNAGNQIKITGSAAITNSVLVGNCAFFEGQSFTYDVDPCRALGNTLEVVYTGGEHVSIVNTTFYGQGDGLVGGGAREGYNCNGTETLTGWNNVFVGDEDFYSPGDIAFLFYQESCPGLVFEGDYSIAYNVKNYEAPWVDPPYPSTHNLLQDPQLTGPFTGTTYGMMPTSGSFAIDTGDRTVCPATDYRGTARPVDGDGNGDAVCDMGAYEGGVSVSWVYLPLILKGFTAPSPSLPAVNDFLYQLQNLDLVAIGNTAYDLVVMDYSSDGSEAGEFTAAQITALKHSPGEKIVLAYMSIGEVEDYRFYWQDDWTPENPAWLDAENPDWPGNYKVHYWDPAWQTIVLSYTDRLLDAGFDGAYLDIIDAYDYYAGQGRTTAAQEMADFVAAIRAYARAHDPHFYIFAQNAPELASLVTAYLDSVDGIGQEDIYYGYEDDE